jgi:hypothetical protein
MSSISRSKIYRCYSGNFRWGVSELLYPNAASKAEACRGYGFVYGNVSASDPAYCGGEVHTNEDCKSWWVKKAIGLDLLELTGGASAAYATNITRPDIQTCEKGIAQESQFNTGCTITSPVIQDMVQSAGSTDDVIAVDINGYENRFAGGYFESGEGALDFFLHLGPQSRNNTVVMPYLSTSQAKRFLDAGLNNLIDGYSVNNSKVSYVDNIQREVIGLAVFDSVGTLIESLNCTSVVINGAGDININWATSDITSNSRVLIQSYTNPSGHPFVTNIFSQSATTTRFFTYNLSGGAPVQTTATKYIVEVY